MMQIFVRNNQGNTITLNVESYETICSVMRKFKEKEKIDSDLRLRFIYAGILLEDERTLADYNVLRESTLHLLLGRSSFIEIWNLYVETRSKKILSLKVNSLDTIYSVKAKLQVVEGVPLHKQSLFFLDTRLDDGNCTLSDYNITKGSRLHLDIQSEQEGSQSPNVTSQGTRTSEQAPLSTPPQTKRAQPATQTTPSSKQSAPSQLNATSRVDPLLPLAPRKTKKARKLRKATKTTSTKATPNSHSIFNTNDGEVCAEYIQGLATSADRQAVSHNNYDAKLKLFALYQAKATAALSDLMPQIRTQTPPSVLTELEDLKREMATARSNKKELEATVSRLTQKNKEFSGQIVALNAQNKKTEEALTVAHNKEKDLEVTISGLKCKNEAFSARCAYYERRVPALEAEDKKTKQELMVARSKEKEQEATISRLTHKNKVFSAQCSSYESQVVALEAEDKKTKELMFAAGYAEGFKEANAKRLKSVEFLHHLTDASMQYFDYGFDSCQKQAEQQGFVGKLNKDSALREAPELEGWESNAPPE